jgi:peptidyl-prolyl cis-trans isomerase C
MMRKTLLTSLILIATAQMAYADTAKPAAAAAPAAAASANKPVAIVNGREIPALYGALLKKEMMAQGLPDNANTDTRVRESLINAELLSRAAIDKGLDKDPDTQAALNIQRMNALSKIYLENYLKAHPVTETEMKSEYDKAKAAASGKEFHARHILVKTEAEAKKIIAQLESKKASFADLAKKYSQDPGSAKKGGDLGWADPASFVKEFTVALESLKKGEFTKTPVKTQFGYHIIELEDTRPQMLPPFAEVKGEVQKQLQQKRIQEAVTALRQAAKVQ